MNIFSVGECLCECVVWLMSRSFVHTFHFYLFNSFRIHVKKMPFTLVKILSDYKSNGIRNMSFINILEARAGKKYQNRPTN